MKEKELVTMAVYIDKVETGNTVRLNTSLTMDVANAYDFKKIEENEIKRERGITLIALVITVIVMLILVGVVTSAIVGGDGIFNRVTQAQKEYKKQSLLELVDIVKLEVEIDKAITNEKSNISDVIDKVVEEVNLTEKDYIISEDEEEQKGTIIDKETGVVIDIFIDEDGNIQSEGSIVDNIEDAVNRIDTTSPTTAIIESSNVEEITFTLTATGADGESGIQKYEFYINNVLEETVTTTEQTATYNVTGKIAGTSYTCKVRIYDKAGNYKDRSEITVTIKTVGVVPEEIAKIGDFVNYSVIVDDVTYDKWRILDFDNNGHIEIVCYNGPSFAMHGTDGYYNAISILNSQSQAYKNGTYGYGARHLGSDPSNPSSYEKISYSDIADIIWTDFKNSYVEQTHHEIDIEAVATFEGTNKLIGRSWLASRAYDPKWGWGDTMFYVLSVDARGSVLEIYQLFFISPNDNWYFYSVSNAIAPVVSLESGVKIIKDSGDGSEGSPWKLTK